MRMWQKLVMAVGSALTLAACGGGGGGNGTCLAPGGCGGSSSSSSGGVASYNLSIAVTNINGGGAAAAASKANPVLVAGTLTTASGTPVGNAVLSFSADNTNVAFGSDRAITNTQGSANSQLSVASENVSGVAIITVKATVSDAAGTEVTRTYALQLNNSASTSSSSSSGAGVPSKILYKATSPTRIFTSTGSQGNTASEVATVTYEVRDSADNLIPGATVYFDVTRRDGGVQTNGSASQIPATTNSQGVATVEVRSGSQPIVLNVLASLTGFTPPASGPVPAGVVVSGHQITISGARPHQTHISLLWEASSGCADRTKDLVFPCNAIITLGDATGQAIADGTVVQFVSSNGIVVADVQGDQPSGACVTVGSKCTVEYTGLAGVPRGAHVLIAYLRGAGAPASKPVTYDGSWVGTTTVANGGNVVVSTDVDPQSGNPQSNDFIRQCIASDGAAASTCVAP